MPERTAPGAAAAAEKSYPASPSNPLVQKALAFNKLTSVPDNWVLDSAGRLRLKDADGTLGPQVPIDQPTHSSFLNELLHALPYLGAAIVPGVANALITGGSQGAAAVSAATSGVDGISVASTPSILGGMAANTAAGATAGAATGAAGGAAADLGLTLTSTPMDVGGPAANTAAGAAGATGVPGAVGKGVSPLSRASDIIGGLGDSVGSATQAAGNNRLSQEQSALIANGQNITGLSAMEQQMLARAAAERTERSGALKDVYRSSYVDHPNVSPFNPVGAPSYSDQYKAAVSGLGTQGTGRLAAPPAYSTKTMPSVTPYKPIDLKNVQGATNTQKSALERLGDWLSPGLSATSAVMKLFG